MTTTTLAEQAARKIERLEPFMTSHRAAIAQRLIDGETTAADIATEVSRLAADEGELHVWRIVEAFASRGDDVVRAGVTDLLLAGADDTWSGRGNDARRAYFDGVRETARGILRNLDF